MNPLNTFYKNEVQREAVKQFMIDVLGEMAVQRAFDGKGVQGFPEARELVENSFGKLKELYGQKEKPIINSSR